MAGLLDANTFLGNEVALEMVKEEAEHFTRYYDNVIAINGTEHWLSMLEVEFGGMNEVLFNLYDVTGDPEHIRCALLLLNIFAFEIVGFKALLSPFLHFASIH